MSKVDASRFVTSEDFTAHRESVFGAHVELLCMPEGMRRHTATAHTVRCDRAHHRAGWRPAVSRALQGASCCMTAV